ncbi:MAG: hypothetical protein ACRD28_08730 [Acidobacteriaceae bacterium]
MIVNSQRRTLRSTTASDDSSPRSIATGCTDCAKPTTEMLRGHPSRDVSRSQHIRRIGFLQELVDRRTLDALQQCFIVPVCDLPPRLKPLDCVPP